MKKVLGLTICIVMLLSVCSAASFSDMPDNWSTEALQNAVNNGLIGGSNGLIRPDDPLKRAEMAAIMVRAFGADEEADISNFVDVNKTDWFYSDMAKAVKMGAFTGDGQYLYPTSNITRQETFAVLARMFSLDHDREIDEYFERAVSADTVLSKFADGTDVAAWAKNLVAAVVSSGYVTGSNGRINPNDNITRAEFAAVMNRLVTTYIDKPGTYSSFPEGSVVIRSEGVTLENASIIGDLIIGEGAKDGAALKNTNVSGRYAARTGQKNTIESGTFASIRLIRPGVKVSGEKTTQEILYVIKDSEFVDSIDIDMGE